MACINMFNNEQQHQVLYNSTMGPRISFSNDFGDLQQPIKLENSYREAPVSADFAFTVPNYSMISADEVFFKGKMMPLRENSTRITTLKDELLAGDDDECDDLDSTATRFGKGMSSWKERLGLKRSPFVIPKKFDNKSGDGSLIGCVGEIKNQEGVCAVSSKGNF